MPTLNKDYWVNAIKQSGMNGFYLSKPKWIKCVDCKENIERLTPNHKRCGQCAYDISLQRAKIAHAKIPPEINRQQFKDWYYKNLDRERKLRRERQYARKHK